MDSQATGHLSFTLVHFQSKEEEGGNRERKENKAKTGSILQPFVSIMPTGSSPLLCFFTAFRKSLKNVNGLVAKQPLGMKNEPGLE